MLIGLISPFLTTFSAEEIFVSIGCKGLLLRPSGALGGLGLVGICLSLRVESELSLVFLLLLVVFLFVGIIRTNEDVDVEEEREEMGRKDNVGRLLDIKFTIIKQDSAPRSCTDRKSIVAC